LTPCPGRSTPSPGRSAEEERGGGGGKGRKGRGRRKKEKRRRKKRKVLTRPLVDPRAAAVIPAVVADSQGKLYPSSVSSSS
jgi:hypothetical protein